MKYPKFKICSCPIDSWEITIVDYDENFRDRSTIYYHCTECSEDYAIVDFYTGEILYLYPMPPRNRPDICRNLVPVLLQINIYRGYKYFIGGN